NPVFFQRNLVPSLGYPSSDSYITAGLLNTTLEPAIRTGRISARNATEVDWYLQKVQAFEAQTHAEWMKNVLHFGGGNNTSEQQNFAGYLANYATIVQDSSFGGTVTTFLKSSSEPIQFNVSQEITDLIETGTSLLTFFGHATSDGFDQSIDNPENFDWDGRHPLLLGNSCFTGDFHSPGYGSTSERFTILNGKGVIGFLASVKLGFEPYLNIYSRKFYEHLSKLNYGGTIGDHHLRTVQDIQFSLGSTPNLFMVNTCLGVSLQGDPAIVLNSWPLPDLSISENDIFFTPENITAEIDSFDISVVVTNTARGTNQSFNMLIEHNTPEGAPDSIYVRTLPGLLYKDTVTFRLPIDPQFGLGLHTFNVTVDLPENVVEEMPGFDFVNNQVNGVELLISNGGIVPVYPYTYAVVAEPNVTLQASTGNPLASETTYRLEIDTTDTFNSPLLQTTDITQTGGLIEWTPPMTYPDSAVYFWRARGNEAETEEDGNWRESNFQYIAGERGWGQSQIFQFKNNNFFQTEFNRQERQIDFFTGTVRISNRVMGNNQGNPNANEILLNASILEYGACFLTPSIHLAVIDPVSFEAWGTNAEGQNPENDFGNANAGTGCRNRVEYHFVFRQNNPTQMQSLADLLLGNQIPNGWYVVLYPIRTINYSDWDNTPDIYTAFQNLGAVQIGAPDALDNVPYSLIARKGDPAWANEVYGTSPSDTVINVVDIPANGTEGLLRTRLIGPSLNWGKASWRTLSQDGAPGDTTLISLIGVKSDGNETPIFNGEFDPSETLSTDLGSLISAEEYPFMRLEARLKDEVFATPEHDLGSLISAEEYPFMRLEARLKDEVFATPEQIGRWHVLYEQVPEAAVAPNVHFEFNAANMQQGEEGLLSVAVKNISEFDMDSLLVNYWVEDNQRNRIPIEYPRQAPLLAGQILIDTVTFDTRNLSGSNAVWLEVNPIDRSTGIADQPEQNHFNNLMRIPFEVEADEVNPILDVTFDGIHIINGEVVSPVPEILVTLKDENPFLLMDEPSDTAFFKIFVAPPGGDFERVFFSSGLGGDYFIDFIPAIDERNKPKILYRPNFRNDGKHKLLVQASDKSGNASGSIDYRIDFEVINRSTITEVLNYPNPFTTSTQFIFTLTGTMIPDEFKIQIMTVSGKIVREVTQAEFGPIRVGRNQSMYRWDGRDEYGDRLANGVYLYRVVARLNGENIELRDGGASQYFNRGFGKMFLMR
ncbi:MAG: C25 family cysteine peptidase, partial [Flavobacteriales bacterium]|nr:C25 family cysteine peptidase [Flavobacteriales bacterium]